MGADTWVAHTAYEYARMPAGPPAGDDRDARAGARRRGGDARGADRHAGSARPAPRPRRRRPPPTSPTGCRRARCEILELVAQGLSNREIGASLSISEHTAANHIRSILRKTGCANRTEAATYAHRHGLTSG